MCYCLLIVGVTTALQVRGIYHLGYHRIRKFILCFCAVHIAISLTRGRFALDDAWTKNPKLLSTRRHASLVSLPKAQPPPPPPNTEPGIPETVLNVAVDWPRDAPTCRRYDPHTVIYDRVPKSGSGSVQVFFEAARARTSYFTSCWSRLLTRREMIKPWLREYVADPLRASLCPGVDAATPALLNRHVFFVDFGRRAARPLPATGGVLHITVIREPIERCLSRFYYERDSRGLFPPGTTIDECIDRKHPACRFETWTAADSISSGKGWSRERQLREECGSNYLTRWLCGHGPECDAAHGALMSSADPEKAARMLAAAARNVGKHAVVGTLDRLGDALLTVLRLVATTVPSFFGGARDDEIPCNKCGNGSLALPRPPPSAENLQMLHNANALDIALYAYAAERFDAHLTACFPYLRAKNRFRHPPAFESALRTARRQPPRRDVARQAA